MEKNADFEKIIKAIDAQKSDLVELCLQLGNTPSHHAKERRLGEAILQWLATADIKGISSSFGIHQHRGMNTGVNVV